MPWDPALLQVDYGYAEIAILLALGELRLWPLAKGCVIHLLQCALQTWLFSMCAMTGQGQTPGPWSQDLNSLHGIQGHTILPSL